MHFACKATIVTADALNCQKETAEIIIEQKADYLLSVKDNHPNLKKDIEDYVQEACETLCRRSQESRKVMAESKYEQRSSQRT